MVHWSKPHASTAGGMGSIPGWETKVSHAAWPGQKKERTAEDPDKALRNTDI